MPVQLRIMCAIDLREDKPKGIDKPVFIRDRRAKTIEKSFDVEY